MEKAEEVLELYQLDYSDLVLLSSRNENSPPVGEIERLQSIKEAVMENLGPNGPGLIAIKSVPGAANFRRSLLPLARKLALLGNDDRKRILKEHNLGSDVPLKNLDRIVSSFAMQLKYNEKLGEDDAVVENHVQDTCKINDESHLAFGNLGCEFKKLGFLMMDLGLCLARICDQVIGGHELEQSLLGCGTAKGRLIHYHSTRDNLIIKEAANRKGRANGKVQANGMMKVNHSALSKPARSQNCDGDKSLFHNQNVRWQQWHYDYGIFTVLTDPMFMLPCDKQCLSPNRHTYLKIFHPAVNKIFVVKAAPESFIVQVGEAADVLSKGILKATLHCVSKPLELEDLSRQTFVVFLLPAWDKTFSLADYPVESLNSVRRKNSNLFDKKYIGVEFEPQDSSDEIHSIIPPLLSRMRDGMTFAEFSRETTKQYYGGNGLQSKR
ncbi:OLC1v1007211C1 [Oldenlandia corymbosa var. corymbosa]|uniref:OLC1v1007211C1 n=1 Tax=Oldenlandia corymbosa var. corymbosa TaxID=529605 RepID=A0AAV1DM45_OLDCO|nr:OLC1v1007211C1 [Oldenlandia corymbosa var. corymbosa]